MKHTPRSTQKLHVSREIEEELYEEPEEEKELVIKDNKIRVGLAKFLYSRIARN